MRLGGGTGRRTGLKTLHDLVVSSLKTERDIPETLIWRGFQVSRAPAHYNPLQLVFGQFWKKKWQKSAKCAGHNLRAPTMNSGGPES